VFRVDFLGFQIRYKALKIGTQYERKTPKSWSIVDFFFRESSFVIDGPL
jgi:hypothetical protein